MSLEMSVCPGVLCYVPGYVHLSGASYVRGNVNLSRASYVPGSVNLSRASYVMSLEMSICPGRLMLYPWKCPFVPGVLCYVPGNVHLSRAYYVILLSALRQRERERELLSTCYLH
jgi:uncharacterized membrane protein YqaE (UPF0057 family)